MPKIVNKPWGYEYIAFQTQKVAVKVLHIDANERTSLHCHPNKTTGLVLVQGQAIINFIADQSVLTAPSKKMIRRGLFHQTIAVGEEGVIMLEVETPIDQDDLVRLSDNYGRTNRGYENHSAQEDYTTLQIDTVKGVINEYQLGTCSLLSGFIEDFDLSKHHDNDIIMFLNGGVIKSINGRIHEAIQAGDVGYMHVVKKVMQQMDGVSPFTTILVIK